ncbi:MAG: hypothetical protein IPO92_13820 [Saprospiraceae bacterium]|nr:hypothetical protein [Saprospiraceae bacterium]
MRKRSPEITDQFINLYEDRYGLIWIGSYTPNKLYYYKPDQELIKYTLFDDMKGHITDDLLVDKDDIVWMGAMKGLHRYDPKTKSLKIFPAGVSIWSITAASDNRLLLTGPNGVFIFNKNTSSMLQLSMKDGKSFLLDNSMNAVFDQEGDLWISTWGKGLFRVPKGALDEKTGKIDSYQQYIHDENNPGSIPGNNLQQVMVDSKIISGFAAQSLGYVKWINVHEVYKVLGIHKQIQIVYQTIIHLEHLKIKTVTSG